MQYSANLTKGTLKVAESRVIAGLLLDNVTKDEWWQRILVENVLQKRSPSAARTIADYLAQRLRLSSPELWRLVRDGSQEVATHAVLAATIKQSVLLGDFLDTTVREEWRVFRTELNGSLWRDYIAECIARDPGVAKWTPPVIVKLRQNVFHILAEAGFLNNTKELRLQRVRVAPEVLQYLAAHEEHYVLRCIQVAS